MLLFGWYHLNDVVKNKGLSIVSKKYFLIITYWSPVLKGLVGYCDHFASVVCKLLTFQSSSKPQGQLKLNLAQLFIGCSTKTFFFVFRVNQKSKKPQEKIDIVLYRKKKFKYFSLKPLNHLTLNLGGIFLDETFLCRSEIPRWLPLKDKVLG